MKDYNESLKDYDKALFLDPGNAVILVSRGDTLRNLIAPEREHFGI